LLVPVEQKIWRFLFSLFFFIKNEIMGYSSFDEMAIGLPNEMLVVARRADGRHFLYYRFRPRQLVVTRRNKIPPALISLSGATIMCSMGRIDYYVYLRRFFAMDNNTDDSFSSDDFDKKPMVDRCDNDATIELYETHKIDWANQKSAQIPLFLRKVTMLIAGNDEQLQAAYYDYY
jgi:hypothetical protein